MPITKYCKTYHKVRKDDIKDRFFSIQTKVDENATNGDDFTQVDLCVEELDLILGISNATVSIQTSDPNESAYTPTGSDQDPNGTSGSPTNISVDGSPKYYFEMGTPIDETLENSTGDWTYTFTFDAHLYNNDTVESYTLIVVAPSPFLNN